MAAPKLTQYKVLMFDVYGTLIDWEAGVLKELAPILGDTSLPSNSKQAVLTAFNNIEAELEAKYPDMRYSELLARVHAELEARSRNLPPPVEASGNTAGGQLSSTDVRTSGTAGASEAAHLAFGKSIGSWPVFPDTIPALTTLSKHFALTVLSNVDRASFAATQRVLEGAPEQRNFKFAAIYTAEDAGAYKPDPRAREYALKRVEELGYKREEVLVVACSVQHDIAPARAMGLGTVWIDRPGSVIGRDQAEGNKATWMFAALGDMAEAVDREARAS